MRRFNLEIAVGLFMIVGLVSLAYISIRLGELEVLRKKGYTVHADFPSVGGLRPGAIVEIAGVEVGQVEKISLNDYKARVIMRVRSELKLQDDAIASIKTRGLIGEQYVQITPGGSDRIIHPGGKIREIEPPIDLQELLAKFIFGKAEDKGN